MKICHVNLASGFSGGERQQLALMKQQIEMGYVLSAVVNPKSPLLEYLKDIPCELSTASQLLSGHRKSITRDCDFIHVHEGRAVYWALLQHLLFRTPYLITRRIDNPLKDKPLLNLAYRKARHLVGISKAVASEVHKRHSGLECKVVPDSPVSYAVDAAKVREISEKVNHRFLVIQAGKFYEHKGFDVSIEAARLLKEASPDIVFCLLGDGPLEDKLKTLAAGLDNVIMPGRQSNMGDWFAAADVLIHPSYTEGLGSVILEASQAGLPVIGTRAGGIPDIIQDNQNGLLIDIGNARQLADAICRIKQDAALKRTIALKAPEIIRQFDIAHTAQLYQTLYQQK